MVQGTSPTLSLPTMSAERGSQWPAVRLRGIRLHVITEAQCTDYIAEEIAAGRGGWLHTINLDILRRLDREADFAAVCAETTLAVADGMPLIWASRLQRTPLPERVAGSDLISSLSAAVGRVEGSVFLLGGNPGTADGAGRILQERCPGLRVVGTACPDLGFEKDDAAVERLARQLQEAAPDLVFVALGVPKQERLIQRLGSLLPQAWWVGVGISFSFLTGDVERAPRWMQRTGLEWLHRLLQEPRRLAHRYLIEDLPYVAALLTGALWRGLFKATAANTADG